MGKVPIYSSVSKYATQQNANRRQRDAYANAAAIRAAGTERRREREVAADIDQNITVPVDPWFTDLFARARDRVGVNEGTPFSFRLLETMLEPSADGSTVGDYDYVVMYDGRDSCSRSVAFAPELAALQETAAASGGKWLLVFVNGASMAPENRTHYRNMGLEGRAAKDGWGPAVYRYFDIGGYQTPWLHVFDRAGNEIAAAGDSADSASKVLQVLAAKVR